MSITTNNLSVGYGRHAVLEHLDLRIDEGEMVALIGRNGGGKSTLLRTLAGLQRPLSGTISIPTAALVLTEHEAMSHTSVFDIVALGRYPYTHFLGTLSHADHEIILSSLALVFDERDEALDRLSKTPFACLSDGYKQKVLIAKALAQQTAVILLDEPTSHLDIPGRIQVFRLLRTLAHDEHKTIVLVTHELDLARQYADRIIALDDILEAI